MTRTMIPAMQIEHRDIHGDGGHEYELYRMPGDGWASITNVPSPSEMASFGHSGAQTPQPMH